MSNAYPIIILPDNLARISSANPTLPQLPAEPQKPILREPVLPSKPAEPTSFSQAWSCGLLIVGIFILVIYGARSSKFVGNVMSDLPFIFMLLFILAPFAAIYFIYSYHKNADNEKAEYAKKMKQYEIDFKRYAEEKATYKIRHEKSLSEYQTIIYPNYLKAVIEYENEKKRILSDDNVQRHRVKLIADFFQAAKRPKKVDNPYRTGVSEEAFFHFLKAKSENYERNYSVLEAEFAGRYYLPDIVYFDRKNGLLIDIEIDEPYLGSDGSPIHYIGFDEKRNEYFKNSGWIIIRFAEEQVVKYPEQCYNVIENLIQSLKMANFDFKFNGISLIRHWTKDEAYKMAFVRARNRYLSRNLIEKMPNEILIEKRNDEQKRAQWDDDLPF